MEQAHIIGIELVKQGFQLHGSHEEKEGVKRRGITQGRMPRSRGTKPYWRLNDARFQ